jgi:LysR family transcriptional regulator, regulator for metE and metH
MRNTHNKVMIERAHLTIIKALYDNGTLTEAANELCLTQSALSHQIRNLEEKLEIALWKKEGRQLQLTQAGKVVLSLAQQVLPVIHKTEQTLQAYVEGKQGMLRIGVECYPCYQWLTGVIASFLTDYPDVDIDIMNKFQFTGLYALLNNHIDILVTPDPIKEKQLVYTSLFDYESVLVLHKSNPLVTQKSITPTMLTDQTLLTFPVAIERLDIFSHFLIPAQVTPKMHKQIESIDIMIQMVAFNRGVCVLPEWLANEYGDTLPITTMRLGKKGIQKSLYAGMRDNDKDTHFLKGFIDLAST